MAISDSTLNETGENYNQITTGSSNGEIIGSKRKRDLNDVDGDEIQLRQGISDFYEDNSQAKTGESQNDEIAGKKRKRNLTEADKEGPSARIDKGKQPMCDFEAEVDRVLEEEVNSFLGDKYLLKVSTDLEGENKILYHLTIFVVVPKSFFFLGPFRKSSPKCKFG